MTNNTSIFTRTRLCIAVGLCIPLISAFWIAVIAGEKFGRLNELRNANTSSTIQVTDLYTFGASEKTIKEAILANYDGVGPLTFIKTNNVYQIAGVSDYNQFAQAYSKARKQIHETTAK